MAINTNFGTFECWNDFMSAQGKRIDDLERQLRKAKAGWDSCIGALGTAAIDCAATERELRKIRKKKAAFLAAKELEALRKEAENG